MTNNDPTYVRNEINSNPEWELAFILSEIMNDFAPIGWSQYIGPAKCLLAHYDIKPKIPKSSPIPPETKVPM